MIPHCRAGCVWPAVHFFSTCLRGAEKWGQPQESAVWVLHCILRMLSVVSQMVSPACVPKGWECEEESDPWPCSLFSSAQHFVATLRWFSTITHSQFKGSFSAAKLLCPTDGCWDPGLQLSHSKELLGPLMAGQRFQKVLKHSLLPHIRRNWLVNKDLQTYVNLWTEGSFIAIWQETFPPLCITRLDYCLCCCIGKVWYLVQ